MDGSTAMANQTPNPLSNPERPRRFTAPAPATALERAPRGRGCTARCLLATVACILLVLTISANAWADISFDGPTRFIFEGDQEQLTVVIVNEGDEVALVQVTLGWGDGRDSAELPMAISRPLLTIPAHGKASVDILYQGQGLPVDRESYFLLSVLEVPRQASAKNVIQIALKHSLKLFYRPKLPGTPLAASESLRWTRATGAGSARLKAHNDSPYYMTLTDIDLQDGQGNACGTQTKHLMIAPFSTLDLSVPDCWEAVTTLTYSYIDDGNIAHPHHAPINAH